MKEPIPIKWVQALPKCDICSDPAAYDVPTNMGPWANLCERCLPVYGGHIQIGFRRES